jgi:hypothetical protein
MAEANESRAPGERLGAWLAPAKDSRDFINPPGSPGFWSPVSRSGPRSFVRPPPPCSAAVLHVAARHGVPCPACGSTRSLIAWTHFDPLEAFLFNPLFFVLTLGVAGWAAAVLADRWCGTRWLPRLQTLQGRWFSLRLLIPLIVANWLYLCLTLPK